MEFLCGFHNEITVLPQFCSMWKIVIVIIGISRLSQLLGVDLDRTLAESAPHKHGL
jgi:hypothetical protein